MAIAANTPHGGDPQSIGRYRIVECIGKGAMGTVYAADDEGIGRRVAVKVMLADLEDEPQARERFYREARVAGQLLHRNIVTVFDLGEDDGRPYIVMELLHGHPLGAYLRTPPARTLDAKIDLMRQVCEGLNVAHDRGVIHRDVKPSNLFVQDDGSLKILDFGVARLAMSNLTVGRLPLGTPDYMSPEQVHGRAIDTRSDVFAAAGVFYFILTGRPPFAAAELPKLFRAVMYEDPIPLTDAEAPNPLRTILTKGLAKDPEQRYQTCSDMLVDLDGVQRGRDHESHRIMGAAADRYRRIVALVEERRTLGRALQRRDVDTACDADVRHLADRHPMFADRTDPSSLVEPLDLAVASSALSWLQKRHNTEVAAVDALRAEAEDTWRSTTPAGPLPDLTLHRSTPLDPAIIRSAAEFAPPARRSVRARAVALWHRLLAARGQA